MMRSLLLAVPLALGAALFAPTASQAFVGCSSAGGVLAVTMTEDGDRVRIVRGGQAIAVVVSVSEYEDEGPSISVACSGPSPTVTNTELITIEEAPGVARGRAELDLSGGPFAPGATAEADGTSEIELKANMAGPSSVLQLNGTEGADSIDFGLKAGGGYGANLNAAGESAAPDVDLDLNGVEIPAAIGNGGADVFNARGAPGFSGPLRSRGFVATGDAGRDVLIGGESLNLLLGGDGRDRVFGSRGPDYLVGGEGKDLLVAGSGRDFIGTKEFGRARDRDRDRVNCGSGRDFPEIDAKDKPSGCERLPRRDRFPKKLLGRLIQILVQVEDAIDF